MLLLAIPPMIANILACENAETVDAPAAAKSDAVATKETPATPSAAKPAPAPSPAKAPATEAVKPSHGASNSGIKSWFIM